MAPLLSHTLQFHQDMHVTGLKASPVFAVPFQYSANGSIFVQMIDPADMFKPRLYSIKEGKAQIFDWSNVAGFTDTRLLGYFPTSSTVAVLVQASHSTAETGALERGFYLLIFGLDGTFQKYESLDVRFTIMRFAFLQSGKMLVAGYDAVNDESALYLLDENGKVVRAYDPSTTPQERKASKDRSGNIPGVAGMVFSSKTYFVGYKDDVLVWRMGSSDTILDVAPNGADRQVSLSLPTGFVLADLIPSDDGWIVHVQPAPVTSDGAANTNDFRYFEFSPNDGSLVQQLLVNGEVGSLACKSDRKYYSFTFDGKDGLVQYSAE